jgi:methionine aminotransferase
MLPFTSKLPNVGTTIFTVMSELATKHRAINLAQGFPNFPAPAELLAFAHEAMQRGMNQYAPMAGFMPLRERIAEKILHCYGASISPDSEITVTPGGTAALFAAIMAVVKAGDEVIVFEPCYDSYLPTLELCGAQVIRQQLTFPDYAIDWNALHASFSAKTRLIILNTPHNPTGSTWTADDMSKLAAMVRDTDCLILSDEVYEHMVYDGQSHASVSRHPELAARSFVISSFGKTFHVTGWKVAYCAAPAALMQEFRKVHQFNVFTVNTPMQHGIASYLLDPAPYLNLPAFYQRKRDLFRSGLQSSRFKLLPCDGTYFQLADYSAISTLNEIGFCRWLTAEVGVAAIPVSSFYDQPQESGVVRFCFAKQDQTLLTALERLARL